MHQVLGSSYYYNYIIYNTKLEYTNFILKFRISNIIFIGVLCGFKCVYFILVLFVFKKLLIHFFFLQEMEQIEEKWREDYNELLSTVSRLQDDNRKLSDSLQAAAEKDKIIQTSCVY